MLGIRRLTCAAAMGVVALGAVFAAPALAAAPTVTTGAAGSRHLPVGHADRDGQPGPSCRPRSTSSTARPTPTARSRRRRSVAAGTSAVRGLDPDHRASPPRTTYHYRLVATNATGTALGADRTFVTAKIPLSLAITAAPNPVALRRRR